MKKILNEVKSEKFIIQGGKPLEGEIEVFGSKNAAFGVLAACLLTTEECEIDNLPLIEDVSVLLEIFKSIGVSCQFTGKRTVKLKADTLRLAGLNNDLVEKIRASVLLLGTLSHRIARFSITKPGGCSIGARILGPHLDALRAIGMRIERHKEMIFLSRQKHTPRTNTIVLSEFSPTATENSILASVLGDDTTEIFCCAMEPYVQDLCHFLIKMGARISGIGTDHLIIKGVKKLSGARHTLIYDTVEMGTFIALAASTKSHLIIKNIIPEFLRLELLKFKEAHVRFKIRNERILKSSWGYSCADIEVFPSKLKAVHKTHNMPYPGFCPDLLPIFAVLMTQAKGVSLIHDWMYEGRIKYIDELKRMGADAFICDPHRALITGPTPLAGKNITSFDLRAGATLIIAALLAKGETVIHNAYQVDRGYEQIEKRLRKIGANIKRAI